MTTHDLRIENARILRNGDLVECDVQIADGKITSLSKISSDPVSKRIDGSGLILLPGWIDPHVHFRDPGQTYKEDFLSGSRGAVAGGTTAVFDMPNTEPAVITAETLRSKAHVVQGRALCNFGLIAGVSHENLASITSLQKEGAIAFKTFMVSPPNGMQDEYRGLYVTNSGQLMETMQEVRKTGLVHCIHAESDPIVAKLLHEIKLENRKDPMAHYDSRPNFAEEEAVSDAVILAKALKSKIHFVHVSASGSVGLISDAKRKGADISSETCPQYMCFTKELLEQRGPYAKFNPPPRNPEDREKMVSALSTGDIDMVATDHAPHANSEKQTGFEDIFKAPSGAPGVETRLPILLTLVHKGKLSLADIPRMTSTAAAKRFGLYPCKGEIAVGSDADLVLVDYNRQWKIRSSELQTKAWETDIYDGMEVQGRVKYTIVNGEIAYEDQNGFGKAGLGQMVKPSS
jgi:allantoinase